MCIFFRHEESQISFETKLNDIGSRIEHGSLEDPQESFMIVSLIVARSQTKKPRESEKRYDGF